MLGHDVGDESHRLACTSEDVSHLRCVRGWSSLRALKDVSANREYEKYVGIRMPLLPFLFVMERERIAVLDLTKEYVEYIGDGYIKVRKMSGAGMRSDNFEEKVKPHLSFLQTMSYSAHLSSHFYIQTTSWCRVGFCPSDTGRIRSVQNIAVRII